MCFTIQQDSVRDALGKYNYRIYSGTRLVARYWHDARGDEHGIDFLNGTKESWPAGKMIDFIEGGGPQPLRLSAEAVAYLKEQLASS